MLNILIVGNSHSTDTFQLLAEAFRDQMPQQDIAAASLYYSGCSIHQHNNHADTNAPVYRYTINKNGQEEVTYHVTMEHGLRDQKWDIIMLQAAKPDRDDTLNLAGRRKLEAYIASLVTNPYVLAWHNTWPSPDDETFFSPDWVRQPPAGYKENLQRLYGFNTVNQASIMVTTTVKSILPDETYTYKINTGAAIMHAHCIQGIPQLEIWRDYTHLSDLGRLIAAYAMYAQLTGKPITQIGMDTVPVSRRHAQFQHLGDLQVTEEMKKIIISAANYALENPWFVPAQ